MAKTFKQRLADAKKNWGGARSRAEDLGGGDFPDIEDGRYRAELHQCGPMGESKSSSRMQFPIGFTIMEGDFKGQKTAVYHGLETEDNLMYLARDIGQLGWEVPDDLEELDETGKEIEGAGLICIIRLKTKGDFQNLYIDKVESAEDPEGEEEEGEEETTEAGEQGPVSLFEVGQSVSFDWEGEQAQGKIVKISDDGEELTVEDDDGECEVAADDCSLVENVEEETVPEEPEADPETEEGEETFEEGDRVKVKFDDEWFAGTVKSVDDDKVFIAFDDDSEDSCAIEEVLRDDEAEPSFEVGQKVSFMHSDKEMYGTIRSFVSGGESVNVKGDDKKLYRNIPLDDLAVPADD